MAAQDSTPFFHQSILESQQQRASAAGVAHLLLEHSVDHDSSSVLWQRRDSTPSFHQSILWIMTAACMHDSAGIAPFLAPEH
jgi:hypothetical protein